ncbi:hypothetical protein B0F90DRAFT_1776768 [Multifurca ochricompacta]|uniref:NACHT domain-containing protein n=1 Tax=Multifurca ochricompacta TaxID=376703 RepID=A0AAD4LXH9_9AGAM|nr:hypothetical protein B0F90DRAFT_1776768 [Multifurca ochricompacta]
MSSSEPQPQSQSQSEPQQQPVPQDPITDPPPPHFEPLLSPELSEKVKNYQNWLSPPDPSTNHGIAHTAHYVESSQWLIKGDSFNAWKNNGSLFWVHGKTGAGKTILTSAIIEVLRSLSAQESASLAYFYCDFRDPAKRRVRNALSSLLIQLAAQSDSRRSVLHSLYTQHGNGTQQPSDDTLLQSLKELLTLPGNGTTYFIIDALDEGLSSTAESPRDVVNVVSELVDLKRQDLRIFATSLPEQDIHNILHPLASHSLSLHENQEHLDDIISYIQWRIQENSRMRRWRYEDRVSTWEILSEKAAGSWQWIICQIKILPGCLPATVQRVLERMDPSLDGTYARVMQRVPNENWEHAHRMFQFLAASVRPLLVDELSEILTIDYDTGTTPKYEAIWHPETPDADIFTVCHNLVTIDNINGVPTVQFAHVTVPDWLFSERILAAHDQVKIPRYRINLEDSHAVSALTCISSLLHFDEKLPVALNRESVKIFTMANYAAEHWVHHTQYGKVAEREEVRLGLERLFNPDLPIFKAWIWLYDIDNPERGTMPTESPETPAASSLYYAALCGFPRLVEHLAEKRPDDISVVGGAFGSPLHAAAARGHLGVVEVLLQLGALKKTNWDDQYRTPTQVALAYGHNKIAELLDQRGKN